MREPGGRVLSRLRRGGDYWDGWHDARPRALKQFNATLIEDPTRPGGWLWTDEAGRPGYPVAVPGGQR